MDAKDIEKLEKQIEDIKNSKELEKTLDLLKNILDTLDIKTIEKFINLTEKQVELGKEIEKYKLKFEQKFEELEKWKYKITGILISITASAGVLQQLILSLLDNS